MILNQRPRHRHSHILKLTDAQNFHVFHFGNSKREERGKYYTQKNFTNSNFFVNWIVWIAVCQTSAHEPHDKWNMKKILPMMWVGLTWDENESNENSSTIELHTMPKEMK